MDSQWINCDIKNINFDILGKFAVIMADRTFLLLEIFRNEAAAFLIVAASWSIHTNVYIYPYYYPGFLTYS